MDEVNEHKDLVARLWQAHRSAVFPAGLRGAVLADTDMVLLDTYTAGCVSTWLNNGGSLDAERLQILRSCLADLGNVLPLLTDEQQLQYYNRLRRLAILTFETRHGLCD